MSKHTDWRTFRRKLAPMIHDFRRLNPWRYVGRAYDPHRLWVRRVGYPHLVRFRR